MPVRVLNHRIAISGLGETAVAAAPGFKVTTCRDDVEILYDGEAFAPLRDGHSVTVGLEIPKSETARVDAFLDEYTKRTGKGRRDDYSSAGAVEFWSSGGMMHAVSNDDAAGEVLGVSSVREARAVDGSAQESL